MCEQCQAFDDEDEDALAAAFVARQKKLINKAAPITHSLVYPKASGAVSTKDKPNA